MRISFETEQDAIARFVTAVCELRGWRESMGSREAFAADSIVQYAKDCIRAYETNRAAEDARAAKITEVDADLADLNVVITSNGDFVY